MSDKEFRTLVKQLQQGDNSALSFIFEDHADFCIANLQRQMRCDKELAEDIFMDAVINFRDKAIAGRINYLTNVRNYIYTTCVNMVRVYYKNQQRIADKRDEVQMFLHEDDYDESLDDYEQELIYITNKAFKTLGDKCQELLKFFYIEDLNLTDIASTMGFANSNVAKTTKSRCYKKWMEEVRKMQEAKKVDNLS